MKELRNYGFWQLVLVPAGMTAVLILLAGLPFVVSIWKAVFFTPKTSFPVWGYAIIAIVILLLLRRRD